MDLSRPFQFVTAERLWRVLIWLMLVGGGILLVMPFLWLVTSSLKAEYQVFQYPPQWIPDPMRFQNYVEALTLRPFHIYLKNTMVIVIVRNIAVLSSASLCAYGFSRLQFPGRDGWFKVVLATMMVPYYVLMIPQYIIFSRMGWVDTFLPLLVPSFFGGGAFNIFLLVQFFRTIPMELADAGRIDGCTEFGVYWRIVLPLAKPVLATVAIFTFLGSWNELMGPLLYLNSPEKYTLALGLTHFQSFFEHGGRSMWHLLMAASTVMVIPPILVFFAAQRYFIQGFVLTGIRG